MLIDILTIWTRSDRNNQENSEKHDEIQLLHSNYLRFLNCFINCWIGFKNQLKELPLCWNITQHGEIPQIYKAFDCN